MKHYFDTVVSTAGVALSGVIVSVYTDSGYTILATIYSDDGVTTKSNPTSTDSSGSFDFYTADGRYYIKAVGRGVTILRPDVEIADVTEARSTDTAWKVKTLTFPTVYAPTGADFSHRYLDGGSPSDVYWYGYNISNSLFIPTVASEPAVFMGIEADYINPNISNHATSEMYWRYLMPGVTNANGAGTSSYIEPLFINVDRTTNHIVSGAFRGDTLNFQDGTASQTNRLRIDSLGVQSYMNLFITGNTGLPAGTGTNLYLAGGFNSPIVGKIYVGDGSGWQLDFAKRTGSADTTLFSMKDSGEFVAGMIRTPATIFTSSSGVSTANLKTSNIHQHTLTENTTVALSNIAAGQVVTFIIVQHASSAKTFTWPATVHGGMTVSATLSSINVQQFVVSNNGTDLYAVSAGDTGLSGGTP